MVLEFSESPGEVVKKRPVTVCEAVGGLLIHTTGAYFPGGRCPSGASRFCKT